MKVSVQREVVLIFGKTGSGKSTLARDIIDRFDRVIIFDTRQEYGGIVLESFAEFIDFFRMDPPEFRVSCRFSSPVSFTYAAKAAFEIGDCLVVLEEADNYLKASSVSDPDDPVVQLVTRGRHAEISILAITQRPHLVAITLRGMATTVYTFGGSLMEPRDLAYLAQWGFDPEAVSALPRFEYLTVKDANYDPGPGEEGSEDSAD